MLSLDENPVKSGTVWFWRKAMAWGQYAMMRGNIIVSKIIRFQNNH
jgi:hypothetical protein